MRCHEGRRQWDASGELQIVPMAGQQRGWRDLREISREICGSDCYDNSCIISAHLLGTNYGSGTIMSTSCVQSHLILNNPILQIK